MSQDALYQVTFNNAADDRFFGVQKPVLILLLEEVNFKFF